MKTFKNIFLLAALAFVAGACDKDGDFLTVSGTQDVTLSGNDADIVLSYEQVDDLALTIYWSDNGEISLSNPLVAAPENATVNTVQFSPTEDFATVSEQEADEGEYYMQFTHFELNAILNGLGYEAGVKAPLYIRVEARLGENIDPTYSNVLEVNVTPYVIDMTVGYLLDSEKNDSGFTLYSANSDGVYTGFVGCASWWNFYMREGDGTVWGNDGEVGTAFLISSASTQWNMWYPGVTGCYYTIIDTEALEWSALLISSLNVSGDVSGSMAYTRSTNSWTLTYTASSAGTINVTISGSGEQYDINTGDSASNPATFGFSQNGDAVEFGSSAGTISVDVPSAGEVTLTLNLSDPSHYTCTVESGSGSEEAEDDTFGDLLYLSGVDDLISGSWTFDNYLRRYNDDSNLYGGACNVNSEWGYRLYPEANDWTNCYLFDSGDAMSGTLKANDGSESNIPAPDPGLYLFDVSMSALTYHLTAVSSVACAGLNSGADDSWVFEYMTASSEAGVYTLTTEITQASAWGFQIIINEDWNTYFGGAGGNLYLYGSNITDDASLDVPGTYTITVDLCTGTYTIE